MHIGFSQKKDTTSITKFLNDWHHAAAQANAEVFFNSIADDGIYIGTDATERWTKAEFIQFAKPYFDKGKAWDFKPYNRDLHVSKNGQYVWFSELLDTWMGVCRGSGILEYTPKGWKIHQYHLSVTVPNDLIRDFISLVDQFNKKK
jgi:ketosteroid isomerase-like protein